MRGPALLAAVLGLSACSAGQALPMPGSVTLGTAALDGNGFSALAGDQVLVPGSQGGFHVWLKYRVSGMSAGRVEVQRTARRVSDDRLLLTADGTEDLGDPSSAGYWETPRAIPSFMCPSPLGVNVIGERVVFDLVILDEHGFKLGEASAEATARCPTGDEAAFCANICSG